MTIIDEIKLNFDDVVMVPQRSTLTSRKDVELEREFFFYHSPRKWVGIPIMSSNMVPIATDKMAQVFHNNKMICVLHKYYKKEELVDILTKYGPDFVWVSIGQSDEDLGKIQGVSRELGWCPNIVVDVPNAYLEKFVKFCSKTRLMFPSSIICAGNVTTPEMVQELIIHGGVDIVKIQIGPGAQCRTRMQTGVGYGTFSACVECAQVAHGLMSGDRRIGLVCSDGGCKTPGDICKVFGSTADFCMIGTMLAGTDECEGEWILDGNSNKQSMVFYGMSSHLAQELHGTGKKNYRASEGTISQVAYKGTVEDIIQEILGGIRSSCTYIGAKRLKDMGKCAKFAKVNKIHDEQ